MQREDHMEVEEQLVGKEWPLEEFPQDDGKPSPEAEALIAAFHVEIDKAAKEMAPCLSRMFYPHT